MWFLYVSDKRHSQVKDISKQPISYDCFTNGWNIFFSEIATENVSMQKNDFFSSCISGSKSLVTWNWTLSGSASAEEWKLFFPTKMFYLHWEWLGTWLCRLTADASFVLKGFETLESFRRSKKSSISQCCLVLIQIIFQ